MATELSAKEQTFLQNAIGSALADFRAHGGDVDAIENGNNNFSIEEFASEMIMDVMTTALPRVVKRLQEDVLEIDPRPGQATFDSVELLRELNRLANAPLVNVPFDENFPPFDITDDLISEALQPSISFPTDLMSAALQNALVVIQESHENTIDWNALGRSRVVADFQVVAKLKADLKEPNDFLRGKLDEKRLELENRRILLAQKRAALSENVHKTVEDRKAKRLTFHTDLNEKMAANETKCERIRQLKLNIVQIQRQMLADQKEQDVFLDQGREILRSHTENRLAMYNRLHTQVMPGLLRDAQTLKEVVASVARKNMEIVQEGRRQLVLKKDQITESLRNQTGEMRSLNATLTILRRENEQTRRLANAQTRQQESVTKRVQMLKTGIALRKYHANRPGRSAQRWIQLSDDANFLFYAADAQMRKKLKKFRIDTIDAVMLGPCTATFARPYHLHYEDSPSRLFSILFNNGYTLDFAVPTVQDVRVPSQVVGLPQSEKEQFVFRQGQYVKDITNETFEDIFLGIHGLCSLYDPTRFPVFTPERVRWMRFVVAMMFPPAVNHTVPKWSEFEMATRRKHLRRLFGFKYFESRFEFIQAKNDNIMSLCVVHGLDLPSPTAAEFSPTASHWPNGTPSQTIEELLDIANRELTEGVRKTKILQELKSGVYRITCEDSLQLLTLFSVHKKDVALALQTKVLDPENFESVVVAGAFQSFGQKAAGELQ